MALVAPRRIGRAVINLEEVLKESRIRLKLAWLHREDLDPALPQQPPFHAHAWTALGVLQRQNDGVIEENEKTQATLDRLLVELVRVRKIVAVTTHREDATREKVGFGKTLRATRALVEDGEEILKGARQLQAQFPALTPALLERAAQALERARASVQQSKSREEEASVKRANQADERQLALDVLLDSIDHLRAAAMGVLSDHLPRLAEHLEAPLESRGKSEEEEPNPAPSPGPADGK